PSVKSVCRPARDGQAPPDPIKLTSPKGRVNVFFSLDGAGNEAPGPACGPTGGPAYGPTCGPTGNPPCAPTYWITYRGRRVVEPSRLGLELAGAAPLSSHFKLMDVRTEYVDETWHPVYGERSQIANHYQEMIVILQERVPPYRVLWIEFRAYDEGAALRYTLPLGPGEGGHDRPKEWVILRELTQFRFPPGCHAYEEHGTEGEYFRKPVSQIAPGCERPLTVEYPGEMYASLIEAAAFDYPRALLSPDPKVPGALAPHLDGPARGVAPYSTPWRGFVVGDRPGDLLERNDLVLNLSPPCQLKDVAWIRPGKAIREVTLSTQGGKECVDFAVAHNLQYVEFDAGWYGPENSEEADATAVSVGPARTKAGYGGLDVQDVSRYATERGVG